MRGGGEGGEEIELRSHSTSTFMVPPGRTLHLRHLNAAQGPVPEIRHPTAFTQIHLSPRMFLDHFPTLYVSVLERILTDMRKGEGKGEGEGEGEGKGEGEGVGLRGCWVWSVLWRHVSGCSPIVTS